MKSNYRPTVIIEGLDGSGKSTSAQAAAQNLSELYPKRSIAVTDSSGFYNYRSGELTDHRYRFIADLKPGVTSSRLESMVRLGAFTLSRQAMDYKGMLGADLLISVRDSHRIEPSTYAKIYAGPLGRLSTRQRLTIFDRLSHSPPADSIIHLQADAEVALTNVIQRDFTAVDPHESPRNMELVAKELPRVINEYGRLFGAHIFEVEGLQPSTCNTITSSLEPIVARAA